MRMDMRAAKGLKELPRLDFFIAIRCERPFTSGDQLMCTISVNGGSRLVYLDGSTISAHFDVDTAVGRDSAFTLRSRRFTSETLRGQAVQCL
jgi:hypothetical protein